jgi:hypothetical protein
VSVWSDIFLGVIAVATLTMAIGLVGMFVAARRLARQVTRLLDQVEAELKPVFGSLNALARDASKAAALASAQVERIDRLVTDLGQKLDHGFQAFQATLGGPAREGFAVLSAIAAAIRVVRDARSGRTRADEDDALFI